MSRRFSMFLMAGLAAAVFVAPLHAQEAAAPARTTVAQWSIITAGFALAFAAAFGALGQARGSTFGERLTRSLRASASRR